jgi:ADP-dependent NAD(P)H-hydrate dehydratase / NAD(P)H-hydrate epimerase
MTPPPGPILTASEMRAAEEAVMTTGVSVDELMERAGAAVAEAVWRYGGGQPILILCGPGNNGGDGYVAARHLKARGAQVRVAAIREPRTPAAIKARAAWDGPIEALAEAEPAPLLVDCLFGTGLKRDLEHEVAAPLGQLARFANFRIGVDLPSGVGTDDGAWMGAESVQEGFDLTLALGALKPAHVLQPSASSCGIVKCLDIGVAVESKAHVLSPTLPSLAPYPHQHKYDRAVAVLQGDMPGAAQLAAEAAARIGGYVALATGTQTPNRMASLVQRPLEDLLTDKRFETWVIGPGLGRSSEALQLVERFLASDLNLVLDADALWHLADIGLDALSNRCGAAILTPHAGEFDRLFGASTGSKIGRTRHAAIATNALVLHKGADTIVANPDGQVFVPPPAPSWLASAGTGDVLAGLAGALLSRSQVYGRGNPANLAALIHHAAAIEASAGLIAEDLITALPKVLS